MCSNVQEEILDGIYGIGLRNLCGPAGGICRKCLKRVDEDTRRRINALGVIANRGPYQSAINCVGPYQSAAILKCLQYLKFPFYQIPPQRQTAQCSNLAVFPSTLPVVGKASCKSSVRH